MIGGYRVLDAHVHMQPWSMLRPAVRALMERGRSDAPDIVRYQSDRAAFESFLASEGIDAAVLVNYVAPDVMGFTPQVNDWVLDYARRSERLLPMGGLHPRTTPDVRAEAERLVAAGLRAFKVHPGHQLLYPHEGLDALYEVAARRGIPVTFHSGTSVFPGAKNRFADPLFVDDVAVDHPHLKVLLAHAGRPFWYEKAFFLARRHENVHLELSGIPPRKLLDVLPRLGEIGARCVWGSDWPSPGVRSLRKNVEEFLQLPLPDAAKGRILWENGARLFGIS